MSYQYIIDGVLQPRSYKRIIRGSDFNKYDQFKGCFYIYCKDKSKLNQSLFQYLNSNNIIQYEILKHTPKGHFQMISQIGYDKFTKYPIGKGTGILFNMDDQKISMGDFIGFIDYQRHVHIYGYDPGIEKPYRGFINNYDQVIIVSCQDPDNLFQNQPQDERERYLRRITQKIILE